MENPEYNSNSFSPDKEQEEESSINLKELWLMAVSKWYWFAISICVTCSLAVLYLMRTPPEYTRSAQLLVKEDTSKGRSANVSLDFSDLGMLQNKANIQNEVISLKAVQLMGVVVERLQLNDNYSIRRGLRRTELYRSAPVLIEMMDSVNANNTVLLDYKLDDAGLVTLNDFKLYADDEYEFDETVNGKLGDTINTPVGKMVLVKPTWEATEYVDKTIRYAHTPVVSAAQVYENALTVSLVEEKSTVISLTVEASSVAKADDILTTLINVYNEQWVIDKNRVATSTSRFINDRLAVIENELGSVDSDISSYKSEHMLPDVAAVSELYLKQTADNQAAIEEIRTQIAIAETVRRQLTSDNITEPLPANTAIQSSNIQADITQYNNIVLDRNRMLAASSEKNPLVRDSEAAIRTMRTSILQSVDTYIASLSAQERSLRGREASAATRLSASPNQARYLLSVERQQKVKEALYLFLLQKREDNELSQAFTAYNTRVVNEPNGSILPSSPKKLNVLLVAFVLGALIPFVVLFVRETLNTCVRGRKDLESLDIPFVGEIPRSADVKADSDGLIVKEGSRDIINEAFRVVRTNLDFMNGKDGKNKVMVVTSFNPGSGKSFLTRNIAMAYALRGRKVLIVDCDMRHGSTSKVVGMPKKGLADYLAGRIDDLHAVMRESTANKNLSVLPVGTLPPNPVELLESDLFANTIERLREEYDMVFIDCPPVDIVADTQIVSRVADRTLFVVRAGLLERAMLPELNAMFRAKRFKNMAMILNGTTGGYGRYSYQYGYATGARYGYYGYYSDSADKKN